MQPDLPHQPRRWRWTDQSLRRRVLRRPRRQSCNKLPPIRLNRTKRGPMMPKLGVMLCLVLWSTTALALAEGNASLTLGMRSLDEGIWEPVDDHVVGGVNVDFAGKGWPLHLAAGITWSDDEEKDIVICIIPIFCIPSEEVEAKASLSELYLGVVKIWKPGERVRLFLGGGGSMVD